MKSLFFIPANREKFFEKAYSQILPDNVIFDLEDAIAESEIDQGIKNICKYHTEFKNARKYIRIDKNQFRKCIDMTKHLEITGYVVPKIEDDEIIKYIAGKRGDFRNIVLIETIKSFNNIDNIMSSSDKVDGIAFGGEDYCLDAGCTRNENNLLFARMRIIEKARIYGVDAYDTIYPFVHDLHGFRDELLKNFETGFDGKMIIHPLQLEIVKEFNQQKRSEFLEIICKYEENLKKGESVLVYKGRIYERNHIFKLKKQIN